VIAVLVRRKAFQKRPQNLRFEFASIPGKGEHLVPGEFHRPGLMPVDVPGVGGDGGFRSELRKTKSFRQHCDFLQQLVEKLINKAPFRKSADKTREFLFNTYERPLLKRADVIPSYEEVLEHIQVPPSYHINVGNHLYSVPHTCIRSCVEVHLTNDHVIVYRAASR
jgi:uncharacterized protein (UPF0147 family)